MKSGICGSGRMNQIMVQRLEEYLQKHPSSTQLHLVVALRERTGAGWLLCREVVQTYCTQHGLSLPVGKALEENAQVRQMVKSSK